MNIFVLISQSYYHLILRTHTYTQKKKIIKKREGNVKKIFLHGEKGSLTKINNNILHLQCVQKYSRKERNAKKIHMLKTT